MIMKAIETNIFHTILPFIAYMTLIKSLSIAAPSAGLLPVIRYFIQGLAAEAWEIAILYF
jgi:hypothetical protein